ncbi:unnamed protein product (macronuclear) [Paramecium tetraurelia]|uniref:ABC transporter n=1 Tax=Paramecium tetraurelia TaxID=5888 RepID=A0C048_PARTE|nr:uncharacterized protein GSPATT00006018001 [Paramecium tetraurelia]CAK64165.1 unnamed protein product [Paramecium tetraurelia]|eukprot:XP_001431563.1 hypothetical protein (macronuclear) [Paramecium tetraurelia strain d4-2]
MQEGKKSKQFFGKDIMNLLKLMVPEKRFCIIGMSVVGLNSALLLYLPQVTTDIAKLQELKYDQENKEKSKQTNLYYHIKWGGVCLLGMFLGGARRFLNTQISNRVGMRMRYSMFQKLMSTRETQQLHSQQLVHKLSNDVSLVSTGLSQDIFVMIRGFITTIGGAAYLSYYAFPLLASASAAAAVMGGSAVLLGKYMSQFKVKETQELGSLSEVSQEMLQAHRLIKLSDMEQKENQRYSAQLFRWYEQATQFSKMQALNMGLMEGGGLYALILILFQGCYLVATGHLDPELAKYFIQAVYMASGTRAMIAIYNELVKTAAIYKTILDIHPNLHESELYNQPDLTKNYREYIRLDDILKARLLNPPQSAENTKEWQELYEHSTIPPPSISFKNVQYSYPNHENSTLTFNLKINSGEIVLLQGPSGSGKTTALNLLTKLLTPSSGEILIDGESLSKKDFKWIQQHVSYVQQDGIIFNATVYENIIYGNHGYDQSMERVILAAKLARAHDFIENMQNKYQTKLKSDGTTSLSGGQKQRIVLARAILKNPRILILDEATSNIDSLSETDIIQALMQICQDKTVIIRFAQS